MKAIVNLFKKKEACFLCGKDASKDFAEIAYQGLDESTGEYESVVGKICKSCADILDSKEEEIEEFETLVDWDSFEKELEEIGKAEEDSLDRKSN